jgi:hypothetical protein
MEEKSESKSGTTERLSVLRPKNGVRPERLLWECKARMEFLVDLAADNPDALRNDRILAGYLLALDDAETLLGLAMGEIDPRADFYQDYLGTFKGGPNV